MWDSKERSESSIARHGPGMQGGTDSCAIDLDGKVGGGGEWKYYELCF